MAEACKIKNDKYYPHRLKRKRVFKGKFLKAGHYYLDDEEFNEKRQKFQDHLHAEAKIEIVDTFRRRPPARILKLKRNEDKELTVFDEYRKRFQRELPKLMINYKDKYAAIVKDEILIEDDEDVLIDRAIEKYGDITMYISKITDEVEEVGVIPKYFE